MVPLLTTYDLGHRAGEPHTLIRVRNLQTTLPIATDAWSRPSKAQPVLISASISLRSSFTTAATSDSVTGSTVHYGILSKAILEACQEFKDLCTDELMLVPMHLRALLQYIHFYLTGEDTLPRLYDSKGARIGDETRKPILECGAMRECKVEIMLPKASLIGSGVSLRGGFAYEEGKNGPVACSLALQLKDLRIPTLIGVNSNERLAKQIVVANVEMEKWDRMVDAYCELEEIVVKTIEESSFQTLEALAALIGERIIRYFLIPHFPEEIRSECIAGHSHNHQKFRISLEKPTAVMFADAPVVEMVVDSDPTKSQFAAKIWQDLGEGRHPPFPLQGRLDHWIAKTKSISV